MSGERHPGVLFRHETDREIFFLFYNCGGGGSGGESAYEMYYKDEKHKNMLKTLPATFNRFQFPEEGTWR